MTVGRDLDPGEPRPTTRERACASLHPTVARLAALRPRRLARRLGERDRGARPGTSDGAATDGRRPAAQRGGGPRRSAWRRCSTRSRRRPARSNAQPSVVMSEAGYRRNARADPGRDSRAARPGARRGADRAARLTSQADACCLGVRWRRRARSAVEPDRPGIDPCPPRGGNRSTDRVRASCAPRPPTPPPPPARQFSSSASGPPSTTNPAATSSSMKSA